MARVLRRPKAAEDIAAVWDFIADDSPDAADHQIDQLDAQLRLLATQPLMGRPRGALGPGVRSFPFGRYVIFYVPMIDGIDDAYRTICIAPSPEVRAAFEAMRELDRAA